MQRNGRFSCQNETRRNGRLFFGDFFEKIRLWRFFTRRWKLERFWILAQFWFCAPVWRRLVTPFLTFTRPICLSGLLEFVIELFYSGRHRIWNDEITLTQSLSASTKYFVSANLLHKSLYLCLVNDFWKKFLCWTVSYHFRILPNVIAKGWKLASFRNIYLISCFLSSILRCTGGELTTWFLFYLSWRFDRLPPICSEGKFSSFISRRFRLVKFVNEITWGSWRKRGAAKPKREVL